MDYDALLNLSADLGYGLLESGAEIYRVEESIFRLLHAYGIAEADPFVIPNCIIVSFTSPDGRSHTLVRRMPSHGTDVDLLERYNDLCRHLCQDPPSLCEARERLDAIQETKRTYSLPFNLAAHFVATAAFCLLFGGTPADAFCSGLCGVCIGLALWAMTKLGTSLFFKSMAGAALSGLLALTLVTVGLGAHYQLIIIGALMALVPGIIFTNAIRDVMAGDMVAGITKIADALLVGVAIALGTAFSLGLFRLFGGV